jgi:hypothetical protein
MWWKKWEKPRNTDRITDFRVEISELVRTQCDTAMLYRRTKSDPPKGTSYEFAICKETLEEYSEGAHGISVGLRPNNDIGTDKRRLVQVCCVVCTHVP